MRKVITIISIGLIALSCGSDEEDLVLNGFSVPERSVTEANVDQSFDIAVIIDGTIANTTASYSLAEGSAQRGIDYEDVSGTAEFVDGRAVIAVPIIGDAHQEIGESFELVLDYEGEEFRYEMLIINDDAIGDIDEDEDGFITPMDYPSMQRFWSDEFEGTELDPTYWTFALGDGCDEGICGWGNNELQNYTDDPSNLRFEDGKLVIEANDTEEGFQSARILTKDKLEMAFGRIDIRAKMPKGQGIWPALWMLGANIDDVSWPQCGEIDIMELVGHEPNIAHGTLHYDNGGYTTTTSQTALSQGDFSDQFHVYTIVWDRDRIEWYIDNDQYKVFLGLENHPFNNDFYFLFNIAVGGNWPGNPDQSTVFPQQMIIDYIRVFK